MNSISRLDKIAVEEHQKGVKMIKEKESVLLSRHCSGSTYFETESKPFEPLCTTD
jgi:hypothetical protein